MARQLVISLIGDASKLKSTLGDAEKSTQSFGKRLNKIAVAGSLAIGTALAANFKAGFDGLQEGAEAEAALSDALGRSSKAVQSQQSAIKANAEQVQKLTRYTYEDALAVGTAIAKHESLSAVVAKGTASASDLTNLTLDLATVMKSDGATAADLLGKALAKPETASKLLLKAGVALTQGEKDQIKAMVKAGDTAGAQGIILDKLKKKTEGAAEAAGNTLAGKMERAKNAFGEVQESLATMLIPAMEKFAGIATKVTDWANENPGKMKLVIGVLGGLAATVLLVNGAYKAYIAVTKAWTVATTVATTATRLLTIAMLSNPIAVIAVAIVALIAVIVLIATKTTWFQQLWSAAWGAIKSSFLAVFNFIKKSWPLILAVLTGPVGIAVLLITKNFGKIKAAASSVKGAFADAFGALTGIVKSAINGVIGVIRRFGIPGFSIPIPLAPDITFGGAHPFSGIPMLAQGGKALAGMAHIVGEKGPELFVPGKTGTVVPNHMLTSRRGGNAVQEVRVVLDAGNGRDLITQLLREIVRIEGGGSTQAAFGRS